MVLLFATRMRFENQSKGRSNAIFRSFDLSGKIVVGEDSTFDLEKQLPEEVFSDLREASTWYLIQHDSWLAQEPEMFVDVQPLDNELPLRENRSSKKCEVEARSKIIGLGPFVLLQVRCARASGDIIDRFQAVIPAVYPGHKVDEKEHKALGWPGEEYGRITIGEMKKSVAEIFETRRGRDWAISDFSKIQIIFGSVRYSDATTCEEIFLNYCGEGIYVEECEIVLPVRSSELQNILTAKMDPSAADVLINLEELLKTFLENFEVESRGLAKNLSAISFDNFRNKALDATCNSLAAATDMCEVRIAGISPDGTLSYFCGSRSDQRDDGQRTYIRLPNLSQPSHAHFDAVEALVALPLSSMQLIHERDHNFVIAVFCSANSERYMVSVEALLETPDFQDTQIPILKAAVEILKASSESW